MDLPLGMLGHDQFDDEAVRRGTLRSEARCRLGRHRSEELSSLNPSRSLSCSEAGAHTPAAQPDASPAAFTTIERIMALPPESRREPMDLHRYRTIGPCSGIRISGSSSSKAAGFSCRSAARNPIGPTRRPAICMTTIFRSSFMSTAASWFMTPESMSTRLARCAECLSRRGSASCAARLRLGCNRDRSRIAVSMPVRPPRPPAPCGYRRPGGRIAGSEGAMLLRTIEIGASTDHP